MFLKILQYSREYTCVGVFLFNNVTVLGAWGPVLGATEYCENFKNNLFYRTPPVAAFGYRYQSKMFWEITAYRKKGTQDLMRTQDPMRLRILWWPRISRFPHRVFNLVEFVIKGKFIYHCWMQINLSFFTKLKICWK